MAQAKRYFGHLATLKDKEAEVWICLAICCTMTEEFADCVMALKLATFLIDSNVIDVRILFCQGSNISSLTLNLNKIM